MLLRWIEDGAEYKYHWAFIPPVKQEPPKVELSDKVANPIDNFVLAKLEIEGLQPSKTSDKETHLRPLSFDLTGLPPTLDEIEAFLKDNSPNAYEKSVGFTALCRADDVGLDGLIALRRYLWVYRRPAS